MLFEFYPSETFPPVDLFQGLLLQGVHFQGLVALHSHGWPLRLSYKTRLNQNALE